MKYIFYQDYSFHCEVIYCWIASLKWFPDTDWQQFDICASSADEMILHIEIHIHKQKGVLVCYCLKIKWLNTTEYCFLCVRPCLCALARFLPSYRICYTVVVTSFICSAMCMSSSQLLKGRITNCFSRNRRFCEIFSRSRRWIYQVADFVAIIPAYRHSSVLY
jgi:hypothetical protein